MEIKDRLYIGGEWVAPAGTNTIEVISPTTEEVIARVPEASEGDVDRAVEAAKAALAGPYPLLTPDERADYLVKLSQAIQARSQELAEVITAEMGSPSSWSLMGQVFSSTMALDGWAELTRTFPFEEIRPGAPVTTSGSTRTSSISTASSEERRKRGRSGQARRA